jgi:hypothetical protein
MAVIDVAVGASILAVYMRRDRGIIPKDRLPDALSEPLDGKATREQVPLVTTRP